MTTKTTTQDNLNEMIETGGKIKGKNRSSLTQITITGGYNKTGTKTRNSTYPRMDQIKIHPDGKILPLYHWIKDPTTGKIKKTLKMTKLILTGRIIIERKNDPDLKIPHGIPFDSINDMIDSLNSPNTLRMIGDPKDIKKDKEKPTETTETTETELTETGT